MNRPILSTPRKKVTTLVEAPKFDYSPLDTKVARQAQAAAKRISRIMMQTLENILAVGIELLAVKQALPHGQFGPWLRAEFDWTSRTARNFMLVAQRFGPKTEIISVLPIDPTAAYLLAAPSAPEDASETALQRAQNGERISASVAREILGSVRKKPGRRTEKPPELPTEKLLGQLLESLESFRQRWHPQRVMLLARQLRDFADSLEER